MICFISLILFPTHHYFPGSPYFIQQTLKTDCSASLICPQPVDLFSVLDFTLSNNIFQSISWLKTSTFLLCLSTSTSHWTVSPCSNTATLPLWSLICNCSSFNCLHVFNRPPSHRKENIPTRLPTRLCLQHQKRSVLWRP